MIVIAQYPSEKERSPDFFQFIKYRLYETAASLDIVSAEKNDLRIKTVHCLHKISNLFDGKARAVVNVVDAAGKAVSGARVTGNFTGAINNSGLSGTTTTSGSATITSSSSLSSGTVTFTVTSITGTGFSYDPAANLVTSASISR